MAKATDELNTGPWLPLSTARSLVGDYAGSMAAAEELLLDYLRAARIRWIYWKQEGVFGEEETYNWHLRHSRFYDPSNPQLGIEDRWFGFWVEDAPGRNRCVTVDWENSSAACVASETLWSAAADYRLSLIRLHHNDVIDVLRLVGLLPWLPEGIPQAGEPTEAPSQTRAPPLAPAPNPKSPDPEKKLTPKEWWEGALTKYPRHRREGSSAYAERLLRLMRDASVTKMWELSTIRRRLSDRR